MLTFEDCLALCDLTEEEIAAIAEHEHVPQLIALELAEYLIHTESGERRIRRMILDDIDHARHSGNQAHLERLTLVLKHFIATHPKCETL